MALRQLAKESCSRLGLSFSQASHGAEGVLTSAWWSRSYAKVLDGLKYAKSHEWIKIDKDIATIGVSDFAQDQLGDVVYVEFPEKGITLEKDQTFGVVESVKTASDVYMPVGGEVIDTNDALNDKPDLVNSGAYTDGWIIKIKMSDPSEADSLMDAAAYASHIEH